MALFKYSARKMSGELVDGQSAAATRDALARQLSEEGMVLVSAKPAGGNSLRVGKKVKLRPLMAFVRELRSLSDAGLPMVEALTKLENRKDDLVLAAAISETRKQVQQGKSLDEAMAASPDIFDPLFQATVRAGVATGGLGTALERMLAFLTIREKIRAKVRKALSYPAFLMVMLLVVLAILMLLVLPRFAALYSEFDAELPALTRWLITSVETAPIWVPILFAIIAGGMICHRAMKSFPSTQTAYDRFRLSLPLIGAIQRETGLVQISFVLSLLLRAGVPLRDALGFTRDAVTNHWQSAAVGRAEQAVTRGQSLASALGRENLYPPLSHSLIEAGENAGDLDRMFGDVAKLHEEQLDLRLNRALSMIEPGIMLVVGLVLGGVIVAVYLPIFGISSVIQ